MHCTETTLFKEITDFVDENLLYIKKDYRANCIAHMYIEIVALGHDRIEINRWVSRTREPETYIPSAETVAQAVEQFNANYPA